MASIFLNQILVVPMNSIHSKKISKTTQKKKENLDNKRKDNNNSQKKMSSLYVPSKHKLHKLAPTKKRKKKSLKKICTQINFDKQKQIPKPVKKQNQLTNCMYLNCNLSTRLIKFYQDLKTFGDEPKCPEREGPRTCLSGEEGIREGGRKWRRGYLATVRSPIARIRVGGFDICTSCEFCDNFGDFLADFLFLFKFFRILVDRFTLVFFFFFFFFGIFCFVAKVAIIH